MSFKLYLSGVSCVVSRVGSFCVDFFFFSVNLVSTEFDVLGVCVDLVAVSGNSLVFSVDTSSLDGSVG